MLVRIFSVDILLCSEQQDSSVVLWMLDCRYVSVFTYYQLFALYPPSLFTCILKQALFINVLRTHW